MPLLFQGELLADTKKEPSYLHKKRLLVPRGNEQPFIKTINYMGISNASFSLKQSLKLPKIRLSG